MMPKMTRSQAKRRLIEAHAKIQKVYIAHINTKMQLIGTDQTIVKTADMVAIDKIIDKCLKRLG